MSDRFRHYRLADCSSIGQFLTAHYQPENRDGNWLRPTWDYMNSHPNLDQSSLDLFGIWEDDEGIIGVVHYEDAPGEAFFQCRPDRPQIKEAMLDYAQTHLVGITGQGERFLRIYINDFDAAFAALAIQEGFHRLEKRDRPGSRMDIPREIPAPSLQEGFRIKSLAEDNDLNKIHRILWRGFDHAGEPPSNGIQWRVKMQSSPNFRKDLTLVVENPGGDYVVFCGMWIVPEQGYCCLEPLATDPDYRRRGLARAAVWEGIRRCREEGAGEVYVGSVQPFYLSLGFQATFTTCCWQKIY